MKKVAIITGITGQDGSLLAENLLEKDYKIYGLIRRTSTGKLGNAQHLQSEVEMVEGDITDLPSILNLCKIAKPHEFYNFAAMSHVGTSFSQPVATT